MDILDLLLSLIALRHVFYSQLADVFQGLSFLKRNFYRSSDCHRMIMQVSDKQVGLPEIENPILNLWSLIRLSQKTTKSRLRAVRYNLNTNFS